MNEEVERLKIRRNNKYIDHFKRWLLELAVLLWVAVYACARRRANDRAKQRWNKVQENHSKCTTNIHTHTCVLALLWCDFQEMFNRIFRRTANRVYEWHRNEMKETQVKNPCASCAVVVFLLYFIFMFVVPRISASLPLCHSASLEFCFSFIFSR